MRCLCTRLQKLLFTANRGGLDARLLEICNSPASQESKLEEMLEIKGYLEFEGCGNFEPKEVIRASIILAQNGLDASFSFPALLEFLTSDLAPLVRSSAYELAELIVPPKDDRLLLVSSCVLIDLGSGDVERISLALNAVPLLQTSTKCNQGAICQQIEQLSSHGNQRISQKARILQQKIEKGAFAGAQ